MIVVRFRWLVCVFAPALLHGVLALNYVCTVVSSSVLPVPPPSPHFLCSFFLVYASLSRVPSVGFTGDTRNRVVEIGEAQSVPTSGGNECAVEQDPFHLEQCCVGGPPLVSFPVDSPCPFYLFLFFISLQWLFLFCFQLGCFYLVDDDQGWIPD